MKKDDKFPGGTRLTLRSVMPTQPTVNVCNDCETHITRYEGYIDKPTDLVSIGRPKYGVQSTEPGQECGDVS